MPGKLLIDATALLEELPMAVYATDNAGRIIFYNAPAAAMWRGIPDDMARWSGPWSLSLPDGTKVAHDNSPAAVAIRTGRTEPTELLGERSDGTTVALVAMPTLTRAPDGAVTGVIVTLLDMVESGYAEIELERLAAIVSSSDDAIISKTLTGHITSWNDGASRIFGYTAEEMIGQSVLRIVPPELQHEEEDILSRLGRGERIDHFDTVRVCKDGRRVNVSLTVSPLRDRDGAVVGASKVARDVTERKHSEEFQRLLFDELNHRVKNTLATIQAIASQSLGRSTGPAHFVASFSGRVQALARAHDLLVQGKMQGADVARLIREQAVLDPVDEMRVILSGPMVVLDPRTAIQLALVMHELATNARKYGALAPGADGELAVTWRVETDGGRRHLLLEWRESGVENLAAPTTRGFGTMLIERSLEGNGGGATVTYGADGLSCDIRLPIADATDQIQPVAQQETHPARIDDGAADLRGVRVLIIEDEALVAMEIEYQLASAGCTVVGIVGSVERAQAMLAEQTIDIAFLDANLNGHPVDELAADLQRRGIPFVFATGYGRTALPEPFQDVEILVKPFDREQLLRVAAVLVGRRPGAKVLQFRGQSGRPA